MDKFSRRTLLHLHSQSFLSSYELSRVFNPFASEAVSARCSAISLEYFSPSDSVVHTFSNLGSVVVIFARRGGTLQRDGSRERESALVKNFSRYSFEMHSVKVRCERVKRENSGKKKADFPVVSLSLSLSLARRDDELDYCARHLRVSSLSFGCARFRSMEIFLHKTTKSRKFSQQRDTFATHSISLLLSRIVIIFHPFFHLRAFKRRVSKARCRRLHNERYRSRFTR